MTATLGLIDPNLPSLNSIKKILKNYDCHIFTHPEQLLNKIEREHFDLLISEWDLSTLTGENFCREICEKYPNVPFLFLSGVRDPETKIRALEAGAIDFLTKPFDKKFLLAKLNVILNLTQNLKRHKNTEQKQNETLLPIDQVVNYLKEHDGEFVPKLDVNSPNGYFYDFDFCGSKNNLSNNEQIETLEQAVLQNRLDKKIYDIINVCPNCSSIHLNLRNVCSRCHTPILTKKTKSRCPQCSIKMEDPIRSYHCLNCGHIFNESDSDSKVIYSYFLNQNNVGSSEDESGNYILLKLARENGFNTAATKSFEQLLGKQETQGKFESSTFAMLQLKFLHITAQTKNTELIKKTNHVLLILKKIIQSDEAVFFHPPNILSIKLSVSSIQEAEGKMKKFQYYLNQFELSQLVTIQLSKEELDVVLGFLEKDSILEEGLP